MGEDANGKAKYLQASQWLSANQAAEQMTWAPGEAELIRDGVIADGRWVPKDNVRVLKYLSAADQLIERSRES